MSGSILIGSHRIRAKITRLLGLSPFGLSESKAWSFRERFVDLHCMTIGKIMRKTGKRKCYRYFGSSIIFGAMRHRHSVGSLHYVHVVVQLSHSHIHALIDLVWNRICLRCARRRTHFVLYTQMYSTYEYKDPKTKEWKQVIC